MHHRPGDVEVTTCEPHGDALIPVVLFRLSVARSSTLGMTSEGRGFEANRSVEDREQSVPDDAAKM